MRCARPGSLPYRKYPTTPAIKHGPASSPAPWEFTLPQVPPLMQRSQLRHVNWNTDQREYSVLSTVRQCAHMHGYQVQVASVHRFGFLLFSLTSSMAASHELVSRVSNLEKQCKILLLKQAMPNACVAWDNLILHVLQQFGVHRIYSGLVKEWRLPLPAYNVSMAAPLDGFDANTYRPRSPCWITPLSILDL